MLTAAPRIETERLLLISHRLEDFADCSAMWMDPEVVRFISGKPSTKLEVWHRLQRYVGHWPLLGFGTWAVRDKGSGRYAGALGFADNQRDLDSSPSELPELGYVFASWCHGRGFATEAVRAICAWGDEHLPQRRTWCLINPEAKASLRVAEKCGYREFAR